jgi:4-hydroxy-tetrahydrodipicolinate reductase
VKIALHGYGKMGKAVEQIARERGHDVVATADLRHSIAAMPLSNAQVLIDFSHASAVDNVVDTACRFGIPLVIGTTGWQERTEAIRSRCEAAGIGVVHSANFSPGANVAFALAREAGRLFATLPQYGVGIEERHHAQKKDSPSGTAIRLARDVRDGSGGKLEPAIVASRVGAEFGLHTIFFDSADDVIEIVHRARGRDGFARGAVLAAELILGRKGFHSFEQLLLSRDGEVQS